MEALIKRFKKASLPTRFVYLQPGVQIVDPERWRDAMLADIDGGPEHARALTGALQTELEAFFRVMES